MHRGLYRGGIRRRGNHDNVDGATRLADGRQEIEPAVLLHVDIQQHKIDLLLRIVNHLLGLTERRSAPAATKAGNPCHVQAIQFGHHGIIVNN